MIKVLLIGPLDPEVPTGELELLTGGETTYVRSLLLSPPKGVVYMHWSDALKRDLIEITPLHILISFLVKLRILPTSSGSFCIKVKKGNFDLVHSHSNSIKVDDNPVPIVISDSSSNYLFLRDYLGWKELRINFGYFLRRHIFNIFGIVDCDTNWQKAKKIIVFSKFAQKVHVKLGVSIEKLVVIPPGLKPGSTAGASKKDTGEVNILFIGTWFERKGGVLLLEAFKILSKKYSNLRLTVVGPVPKKFKVPFREKTRSKRASEKCKVFDYVPRERLMKEYFPKADIFVLVPPVAEGFGFVVLEAMMFGIAAIVTDVYALSELVENGKTGFVIKKGNLSELVGKLEILIQNETLRKKMGASAKEKFQKSFTERIRNKQMLSLYQKVLSSELNFN